MGSPDDGPVDFVLARISQIGPYEIGKSLGKGSFATVKAARHVNTGEKVAIKFISKTLRDTDDYWRTNFYREAQILKQLAHPNVIQLYEVFETDHHLCLVTERAVQDLLTHILENGTRSEAECRKYFRQLISVLDHLHQSGIVHRDLKIENLMLDEDNNIKLIDFGLSNDMKGKKFLQTSCGSLAYSAPELVGCKPYGKEVDIWSLGVCLYVILSGHMPFPGDRVTEIHAAMLDGTYKLADEFDPLLKDLFAQLFQVRPAKRITIDGLKRHEWVVGKRLWDDIMRPFSSLQPEEIDSEAVQQMLRFGFPSEHQLRASIQNRAFDRACSTYYLLLKRRNRAKQESEGRSPSNVSRRTSVADSRRSSLEPDDAAAIALAFASTPPQSGLGETLKRTHVSTTPLARSKAGEPLASPEVSPDPKSGSKPRILARSNSTSSRPPTQSGSRAGPGQPKLPPNVAARQDSSDSISAAHPPLVLRPPTSAGGNFRTPRKLSTSHSGLLPQTFASLVTRLIKMCEADDAAEETVKVMAACSHEALLLAPDSSFYEAICAHGWNGVTFAARNLDLMDLASDLFALMGSPLTDDATSPVSHSAAGRTNSQDSLARTASDEDNFSIPRFPDGVSSEGSDLPSRLRRPSMSRTPADTTILETQEQVILPRRSSTTSNLAALSRPGTRAGRSISTSSDADATYQPTTSSNGMPRAISRGRVVPGDEPARSPSRARLSLANERLLPASTPRQSTSRERNSSLTVDSPTISPARSRTGSFNTTPREALSRERTDVRSGDSRRNSLDLTLLQDALLKVPSSPDNGQDRKRLGSRTSSRGSLFALAEEYSRNSVMHTDPATEASSLSARPPTRAQRATTPNRAVLVLGLGDDSDDLLAPIPSAPIGRRLPGMSSQRSSLSSLHTM
eukprot:m.869959 g.869959  ORF g.869959 m.869959 type:complete len:907 (+) comp59749_c0_seq7:490-3210(+)